MTLLTGLANHRGSFEYSMFGNQLTTANLLQTFVLTIAQYIQTSSIIIGIMNTTLSRLVRNQPDQTSAVAHNHKPGPGTR
jgi:uncharacterized membrane protein